MKEYAEWFYSSKVWKRCRAEYVKSVGGLCEECLKNGKVTAGVIVHHKIYVNPNNIHDPSITLNPDNLVLLCRECHEHEHRRMKKRYKVEPNGSIQIMAE